MKNGNRVVFDSETGHILYQTYDSIGTVKPKDIVELGYLDLPYNYIDYNKYFIKYIDTSTRTPIVEMKDGMETPEQKYIRELEDLIMLTLDNELGGIL